MKRTGVAAGDYLHSPYLLEALAVVLFGIALYVIFRRGRRLAWPELTPGHKAVAVAGWGSYALGAALWCVLLVIVLSAWHTAVSTNNPKPPSLYYVIFGGLLYFFLMGVASTCFDYVLARREGKWPFVDY